MFYFSDHSSICHVNNLQYFDVRQDYSVWANFSDSNQSSEYVTEAKFGQKISWRLSIYYIWVPPQRTWERFKRCITQFCTESQHSGKNLHLVIWQISSLSKGQFISKADLKVFIWTKNQRKHFCISALVSKMSQLKRIMAHYHANEWLSII